MDDSTFEPFISELATVFPDQPVRRIVSVVKSFFKSFPELLAKTYEQADKNYIANCCIDLIMTGSIQNVAATFYSTNANTKKRKHTNNVVDLTGESSSVSTTTSCLDDDDDDDDDDDVEIDNYIRNFTPNLVTSSSNVQTKASEQIQENDSTKVEPAFTLYPDVRISNALDRALYVEHVKEMFPKVARDWIDSQFGLGYTLNQISHYIMSNSSSIPKDDKKKKQQVKSCLKSVSTDTNELKSYFDISDSVSDEYLNFVLKLLLNDFQYISQGSLNCILKFCNFHYAPAYKLISDSIASSPNYKKSTVLPLSTLPPEDVPGFGDRNNLYLSINLTKRKSKTYVNLPVDLKEEVDWIKSHCTDPWPWDASSYEIGAEQLHREMKRAAIVEQARSRGETLECIICCDEHLFHEMLPCIEGHLFCRNCLRNHAKEVVYGQAKAEIKCLNNDCTAPFSTDILTKALDEEWLDKLEERQREEWINCAAIDNLIRCKYCNFAVVVDVPVEVDKVFKCPNEECERAVCRLCDADWDEEHMGRRCSELETKDETALRKKMEEKMAEAIIRTCYKCKAKLIKSDGCNKLTCRCGAKMCYLCRAESIDYNHFCRHMRQPGQGCIQCTACSLYEDPSKKDNLALEQIQKEAANVQQTSGLKSFLIGVRTDNVVDPYRGNNYLDNMVHINQNVPDLPMPQVVVQAGANQQQQQQQRRRRRRRNNGHNRFPEQVLNQRQADNPRQVPGNAQINNHGQVHDHRQVHNHGHFQPQFQFHGHVNPHIHPYGHNFGVVYGQNQNVQDPRLGR